MKPTIEQIIKFGLEPIEREYFFNYRGEEYIRKKTVKKYKKGVVYAVAKLYGYSSILIAKYLNIRKAVVNSTISTLRNNNPFFENDVSELKDSLDYVYQYSLFAQQKDNLLFLHKESKTKLSFEDWLITRLSKI